MVDDLRARAADAVRAAVDALGLDAAEPAPGTFSVSLPGTRKLTTECALVVGTHHLDVRAFVCRRPDENEAGVHRWLLQRNLKLAQVAFSVDALGDIHLTGRVPLAGLDADAVDRLLGIVADTADSSFNTLLELGFATSIRAEWAWRRSRGESTANLAAFAHLADDRAGESGSTA